MRATVRALPIATVVGLLCLLSRQAPAQGTSLELDHFYLVVRPPVFGAVNALRRAGFTIDTTVNHHTGQGTASIAAFLENAYLELLWVDSATSVDSDHVADVADFRRAASWRTSGASPFGVGLHFLDGKAIDLPIPGRREAAPHLGPNVFYLLLRAPAESLAADIFVMPPAVAVTEWLERFRGRRAELFAHPGGFRRITRVIIRGAPANRPRAMDLDPRLITFESAATQYAVVEFDGGTQQREWDLRPVLPLILRR